MKLKGEYLFSVKNKTIYIKIYILRGGPRGCCDEEYLHNICTYSLFQQNVLNFETFTFRDIFVENEIE